MGSCPINCLKKMWLQQIKMKLTLILINQNVKIIKIMSFLLRCLSVLLILIKSYQIPFPYNLYPLSPPFPPTAYVGNYYTCTFRVSGLTNPIFTFGNLPEYFISSSAGTIEGIPKAAGSFSFKVAYKQNQVYASQELVLRIAPSNYPIANNTTEREDLGWVLEIKTMYETGQVIDINLNQNNTNVNQFNWGFLNLPQQLKGDSYGQLKGVFNQAGLYTFAAFCYDQFGSSNDYFFTFNIQSSNDYSFDYHTQPDVPRRNIPRITLRETQNSVEQKAKDLVKTKGLLQDAINLYEQAKQNLRMSEQEKKNSQGQLDQADRLVKTKIQQRVKLIYALNKLQLKLNNSKDDSQLKKLSFKQAANITNNTQAILAKINNLIERIKLILSALANLFIAYQKETSQAMADYEKALRDKFSAIQDYNLTFQAYLNSKQMLQQYKDNQTNMQFKVNSALTEREVANFQNDAATVAFRVAQNAYNKSLKVLSDANTTIMGLRRQEQQAKIQLGNAKFKLNQAMSNLYVAQAAKAQADKAITIISAQNNQNRSILSFGGCGCGAYPSIFGTATILSSSSQGTFALNSGYSILFGNCTSLKGKPSQGDSIKFSGYMKLGYIHGIRLQKL